MKVLFNNYTPQYGANNYNNSRKNNFSVKYTPAFSGGADTVAESVVKKSKFFKRIAQNFEKAYDGIGDWMGKKVIPKIFDNEFTDKFTNKVKESDLLFNHFLAVGSAITSGMYMYKTLTNDKMDKDRKQTLAVNQFLTFVLSTAGAYLIDTSLSDWWQKMTVRYASGQCNDEKFTLLKEFNEEVAKVKAENAEIKKANDALKAAAKKEGRKLVKEELQDYKKVKAEKFLKKRLGNYLGTPDEVKNLTRKISGMGKLKTMLVFGLVYRYLVPVAVTKPANILCEKYLAHKKEKEAEKAQG